MSPDDRRRAIIDAVRPLVLEHGDAFTTKMVAEAAGIAEGTIFRVFPDKDALMNAVAADTLNPVDGREDLMAALDGFLDLPARVRITAEVMLHRSDQVVAVMMALRKHWMSHARDTDERHPPGPPQFVVDAHQALLERLVEVFEPHRDELTVTPERAAMLLRTLVLGSRNPGVRPEDRLTADDVAEVLLHGIRRPTDQEGSD